MLKENKLVLSDFVNGDRFELNSYISHLFNQYYAVVRDQSKDKMIKH